MSSPLLQQTSINPSVLPFRVVAIGASMGGIQAVQKILSLLPPDFGASILLTQHLSPHYKSELAPILTRHTTLPVRWAREGDGLEPV